MKILPPLAWLVAFLTVIGSPHASALTNTLQVFDHDFGIAPATHSDPTIHVGDTIQWVWINGFHSTTAAAGQVENWDAGQHSALFTFFHTFTHAGVFNYYCSIHGFDAGGGNVGGMSGHITVLTATPPPDLTPPLLIILSPVDYQTLTNSDMMITGTVSDPSGVQSITVNATAATLSNTNWSQSVPLSMGTNTFTVMATDNSSQANTVTQIIHVVRSLALPPAPIAGFSASLTNGIAPLPVIFTDDSTGTITSHAWDFGDGNSSSDPSPTHIYTNAGLFSVSLLVVGPGGSNTFNLPDLITVTRTNLPPDTTVPTLTIFSPTDYQVFTSATMTVTGTASDDSGIHQVTVNGVSAALVDSNWSLAATLAPGTNAFTVMAMDNSPAMNTAMQIVHAVLIPPAPYQPPVLTSAPAVTNALLTLLNRCIVAAGDTNLFTVSASDPAGSPLSYQWQFGNGVTNPISLTSTAPYVYPTNTDCGPLPTSVTVSDGETVIRSNLTVIVACRLTVAKLQATVNFAKLSNDLSSVTATLDLEGINPANQILLLNIGGAQQSFQLDSKNRGAAFILDSKGRSLSVGTCRLTYTKSKLRPVRPGFWTFTCTLSKGSWREPWNTLGMVNATIGSTTGNRVTLPVVVVIGDEAFAAEKPLLYTAKAGQMGTAK